MDTEHTPRILIADDQPDVLEALRFLIKGEGCQAEAAASPAGIVEAIEARDFDAVLMDLNYTRDTTSGQEGLDLLIRIQALDNTLPVIVMTAWGSVDLAVEAATAAPWRSGWKTTAPAWPTPATCSSRSSQLSRAARASGWCSAAKLPKATAAA